MNKEFKVRNSWFDPDTSFFDLAIVQISFAVLIFFAVLAFGTIAKTSDLTWDFSYNGFNQLLVIFRFPIGLLAVLIPWVAVLAANHRSAQTKAQMALTKKQIDNTHEQIKITIENNAFSNYFKHSEEFDKHLKLRSPKSGAISEHSRHLHRMLFPDAKRGVFHVDEETFKKIDFEIENILVAGEAFSDNENMQIGTRHFNNVLDSLLKKYSLTNYEAQADIADDFGSYNRNRQLVITANNFAKSIITALEFDEKATPSELLIALSEFNYNAQKHHPLNYKDGILYFSLKNGVRQIIETHKAEARMAKAYDEKLNEKRDIEESP